MAPRALLGLLELAGLSFLDLSLVDVKSGDQVATVKVSADGSKPLVPWQQNTTQYNFALDVPEDVGSFVLQSATPDMYLYNDYWSLDQRPMRRWYTDFYYEAQDAASTIQKVFTTRAVRYSVLCCADHNGNGKCDGKEEAVAGCRARLTPVQPLGRAVSKWALPSIMATSGADGLLTFYPPENYTFGVELVDWPATLVPDTRSTSATFLTSRVLTTPAALDAAPADQFLLSTRKVKVSGSVRDEVGSPIAGAVVAVTHGDFTVKTVTDAKGFYSASSRPGSKLTLSLAGLPAGYIVPTRGSDVEYTSANSDVFVGFTIAAPTDAFKQFCDSIDKTTLHTFGRRLSETQPTAETAVPPTGTKAPEASAVSQASVALANNQGAGGILGQVVDSKGLGVGGAVITVSGPKLPIPLTTLTNESGVFAYPSLPTSVGTDTYIVQFGAVPAGSKLMHRLNGAREVNVIPDSQALVYFQACGEAVSVKHFAPAPAASRPQAPISSASAALIEAYGSLKPADPPGV